MVQVELGRCLSCALCSGCLECERICQVKAVSHEDTIKAATIEAGAVVSFAAGSSKATTLQVSEPGVFVVESQGVDDLQNELNAASAIALEIAGDLKLMEKPVSVKAETTGDHNKGLNLEPEVPGVDSGGEERIGVILCRCGGSISSIVDLNGVAAEIQSIPGVCRVRELSQLCTEDAAREIVELAGDERVSRLVVAACRCCNLEQICFSCTEQRVRCQQYLNEQLTGKLSVPVEYVNIREQCAWVHKDNPAEATRKAVDIITSGVLRTKGVQQPQYLERPISDGVLVVSTGLSGLAAAIGIAMQGFPVKVIYKSGLKKTREKRGREYSDAEARLLRELEQSGVPVMSWPGAIRISGTAGNYRAILEHSSTPANFVVGALVVDAGAVDKILEKADASFKESLPGRIFNWYKNSDKGRIFGFSLREISIGDPTGIYMVPSKTLDLPDKQVLEGKATAVRVVSYLASGMLRARAMAIDINRRLCRGCGDCIAVCPYIEMRADDSGTPYATIDQILCLGCGACLASCPTGAITQPAQSDLSIISTLESLMEKPGKVGATT